MDYTQQTWRLIFEALPIIAAMFTLIIAAKRAMLTDHNSVRLTASLYVVCASLLIFAQSSWSWTMFIKRDILGGDVANIVWTSFNILTMLTMAHTIKGEDK